MKYVNVVVKKQFQIDENTWLKLQQAASICQIDFQNEQKLFRLSFTDWPTYLSTYQLTCLTGCLHVHFDPRSRRAQCLRREEVRLVRGSLGASQWCVRWPNECCNCEAISHHKPVIQWANNPRCVTCSCNTRQRNERHVDHL